jgi:hypothetical protein
MYCLFFIGSSIGGVPGLFRPGFVPENVQEMASGAFQTFVT